MKQTNKAPVALLPKESQDSILMKNYRLILQLNNDKCFMVILAERLKKFLQTFIHEVKSGFLSKRQLKDNVRIILNVTEYQQCHNEKQAPLIFLDEEKTTDNLNQVFIFKILGKVNFGEKFIQEFCSIYTFQQAHIVTRALTKLCEIQQSSGQGCLLSPLCFILVLEVLIKDIKQDEKAVGVKIKNEKYKLRTFADDLVLFLQDSQSGVEYLMKKLNGFGTLAGFKINKQKTKMLVKTKMSDQDHETLVRKSGFKVKKNQMSWGDIDKHKI